MMAVRGMAVRGMAVRGMAVRGMAVRGMAVRGMAVRGMAVRRSVALGAVLATAGATTASAAPPAVSEPPPPVVDPASTGAEQEPQPGRKMAIAGTVLIIASAGGYVAMAVGLGIGTNAEADVRALGSLDEVEERRDVMARGRMGNRLAVGAGVASAVLMATGVALVVLGRRKAREADEASVSAVSWLPLPAGAGVQLGGRF